MTTNREVNHYYNHFSQDVQKFEGTRFMQVKPCSQFARVIYLVRDEINHQGWTWQDEQHHMQEPFLFMLSFRWHIQLDQITDYQLSWT